MMQECDYVIDGFVLIILGFLWLTKPTYQRHHDYLAYIAIICCIKFAYFLDNESSMNFKVDTTLTDWRNYIQGETKLLTMLPLVFMLPLEWKVCNTQELGMM